MESKNNCGGLNESLKPSEDRANPLQDIDKLYGCCCDIAQDVVKLDKDMRKSNGKVIENDFRAIYKRFGDLENIFDYVKTNAQGLEEENRRLKEENRRLKEKRESYEQRKKDTTISPREARKQRKKYISQIRREAVNARWDKERANAEASTPTGSYKAANAVTAQSQNIVPCTARNAATESGKKTLQKTYRPTAGQVAAFMHNALKMREDVAAEEAEKFLNYYDAIGWEFGKNNPVVSWEGVARSWAKSAEEYNGLDIYEIQAPKPQAPKDEPAVDMGIFDDDMTMRFATKMLYNSFQGATGQNVWEMWEMILNDNYTKDPRGRAAWKIAQYFRNDLPKFLADKIRRNECAAAMTKKVREMIEADKFTKDPLGYVARFTRSYLEDKAA